MLRCVFLCVLLVSLSTATPLATEDKVADGASSPQTPVIASVAPQPAPPKASDPAPAVAEAADAPQARGFANNVILSSPMEEELLHKLNSDCAQRETSACIKLKLISYMNKLLKKASIQITEGVEISQTSAVQPSETIVESTLPRSAGDVDTTLTNLLVEKLVAFVKSRSLKWNILPETDVLLSTSPEQEGTVNLGVSWRVGKAIAEGRGKASKQLMPLLMAFKVKAGILGALAFGALVLLVGKALLLSKVALLLAAIIGLKKLFSHKGVTYEVHHDEHGHGGHYRRSYDEGAAAQSMAYNAYAPSQ